jgi:hypothetical protein
MRTEQPGKWDVSWERLGIAITISETAVDAKASSSMTRIFEFNSKDTCLSDVHSLKQHRPRRSMDFGNVICVIADLEKAIESITVKRDGDSNLTSVKARQSVKHADPMNSTDLAMEMDGIEDSANAPDSIRFNFDGVRKVTVSS